MLIYKRNTLFCNPVSWSSDASGVVCSNKCWSIWSSDQRTWCKYSLILVKQVSAQGFLVIWHHLTPLPSLLFKFFLLFHAQTGQNVRTNHKLCYQKAQCCCGYKPELFSCSLGPMIVLAGHVLPLHVLMLWLLQQKNNKLKVHTQSHIWLEMNELYSYLTSLLQQEQMSFNRGIITINIILLGSLGLIQILEKLEIWF